MICSGFKTALPLILTAIWLAGADENAAAVTIRRTYRSYAVSARTISGLQEALNRRGLYIKETGKRHAAASLISFTPLLQSAQKNGRCRIVRADLNIDVTLTFPQWKQRKTTPDSAVARFWDRLLHDMKQHEEGHIGIARRFGAQMEQELRALPSQADCRRLQAESDAVLSRLAQKNNTEQIKFDYIAGKNFKKHWQSLLQETGRDKMAADSGKLRRRP